VTTTVALRIYLLRFQIGHRRLSQNSGRIRRSFDVAPDSCPSYSFHAKSSLETQEVLEVLGVQVDLIRAVGMVGSDLFKNAGVFLSNFAELVELTGNFYTASDKSEAAWWTPIADHEHSSGESRRATDQFLTSRMKLMDKLDKVNYDDTDESERSQNYDDVYETEHWKVEFVGDGASNDDEFPPDLMAEKEYSVSYFTILRGTATLRRGFVPSLGYLGLGPADTREGDIIAILFGADVPFILRKLPNGQYQVIGEAYAHGIMDGEFM
jgi:hypothetical protein